MRILLGFRNSQLGFALFFHDLAKAIVHGAGWVSDAGGDAVGVFCCCHKIGERWMSFALKAVKVLVDKGAGDFACAVRAEVHKYYAVAVANFGVGFTFLLNNGGADKFIIFVAIIGCLQGVGGVAVLVFAAAAGQQVVGFFNAVPAIVAVHREITANQCGGAAASKFGKFGVELLQWS